MGNLMLLALVLVGLLLGWASPAQAGSLYDRFSQFPNWHDKPPVHAAKTDLVYPRWMAGDWWVTSILVDMVAPLAPTIVTPGFEGNRSYLNQPICFQVRFLEQLQTVFPNRLTPFPNVMALPKSTIASSFIVADRAFNGLNLARAYLGEQAVFKVEVDALSFNRQITQLQGGRQLISTVTAQGSETLPDGRFIATEISQQFFRGQQSAYLNEVEVTTLYGQESGKPADIQADQITAIYLSPKDPNYFKARQSPVALYRYHLMLHPWTDKGILEKTLKNSS